MHEAAIAAELVEQVCLEAARHGIVQVTGVEVEIGALELIVPEALVQAFAMAAEDGVAAGATLTVTEVAPRARCRGCGEAYVPEIAYYRCPACGVADAELLAGRGIILKALHCETS